MPAEQLQFFASLDFPGRSTLYLHEIAARIGCTVAHLLHKVDDGSLSVLDIRSASSSRRAARVPIEAYRAFILQHLSAPLDTRMQFLRDLPEAVRRELILELARTFPAPAARNLARQITDTVRTA